MGRKKGGLLCVVELRVQMFRGVYLFCALRVVRFDVLCFVSSAWVIQTT